MTIFGKTIAGFANKIGKTASNLDYGKVRHIAIDAGKIADKGLSAIKSAGKSTENVLGTAQKFVDSARGIPIIGAGASLLGGGLAQARNVVSLGNQGVSGLEKVVGAAKQVANNVDKQANPLYNRLK